MPARWAAWAALAVAAVVLAAAALGPRSERLSGIMAPTAAAPAAAAGPCAADPACAGAAEAVARRRKKTKPYTSPSGLFIQERASKGLPGPGQHFSFGAIKPWEDILAMLDEREDRKLLLMVRHGQAVSNYLGDTLGPDEWYAVEGTCEYTDKDGKHWDIFDADLTDLGQAQAQSLNSMLAGGGWFSKVTGGRAVRAVVSPLTRCLNTATNVLKGLPLNATNVEELCRETLGEDTCDARRSVSDPAPDGANRPAPVPPCKFEKGLRSKFPSYKFKVYDSEDEWDRGFGLLGDSDHLWTKDSRERQQHQVKRAKRFLDVLFRNAPEKVVVIVTHSGFARSLLLAVEREPYRPNNAELVPVIVDKAERYRGGGGDDDDYEVVYDFADGAAAGGGGGGAGDEQGVAAPPTASGGGGSRPPAAAVGRPLKSGVAGVAAA